LADPEASTKVIGSPRAAGLTDEALVRLAQQGDSAAFSLLVERYKAPLYNYLLRMTGQRADADDLFQETFLRVYRHIDRYSGVASFRTWLYRIATNCCHDHWRSWRRRLKTFVFGLDERPAIAAAAKSALPDPRQAASSAETVEQLARAVDKLPAGHRAVFLMARYHGMNYKEIADALEIPEGTVKSRMNKAVHQLVRDLRLGEER